MMAEVFARLFKLTGQSERQTRATAVMKPFGGQPEQLTGMPTLLAAATCAACRSPNSAALARTLSSATAGAHLAIWAVTEMVALQRSTVTKSRKLLL